MNSTKPEADKRRILLTGGAGFIGSHLAEALIRTGSALTVVDNLNDFYDPRIKRRNLEEIAGVGPYDFHPVDILDRKALEGLFADFRPDIVVHLAAYAGVRPSFERPDLYDRVNVTGTVNLLELCRRYPVRRFIYGGTSSVYGTNSKIPFSEDDPLNQLISPYAVTKRAAELMSYCYHHNFGVPVTCLRFFTVYGPRQRPEMAIHKFARHILCGETLQVFHEGRSTRDYTYVDDIVDGVCAALDFDGAFETFNLGNSAPVELLEVIRLLESLLGVEAKLNLEPAQPGDVPATLADISRASARLGYAPKVSLQEGLRRFVDWYSSR